MNKTAKYAILQIIYPQNTQANWKELIGNILHTASLKPGNSKTLDNIILEYSLETDLPQLTSALTQLDRSSDYAYRIAYLAEPINWLEYPAKP